MLGNEMLTTSAASPSSTVGPVLVPLTRLVSFPSSRGGWCVLHGRVGKQQDDGVLIPDMLLMMIKEIAYHKIE